ncbi:MAG: hypothetical protein NVS3B26_00510 [Mycobacteriales bacterium]
MIDAVLFDWGGTLSVYQPVYQPVDLMAMWHAAAVVLAPDDPAAVAARFVAAEAKPA